GRPALRWNPGQAEPQPGAAGRPGGAAAGRAVRRVRLGHLPAVLVAGGRAAAGRPIGADHQPLRHRRGAFRPHRPAPRRQGGAAMTTVERPTPDVATFSRRFLADYRRNPVNLLVLVLVPVVFVLVAAKPLADSAAALGGTGVSVETASAGWAAGLLAGIAMYFQTRAAPAAGRRPGLARLPPSRLVAARLPPGLALAAPAAAAALLALMVRTGIAQPGRVIAGTAMFAVIYLAVGALTGALVRNPVNGTVLVLFVWIIDVFFGPA